MRNLTKFAEANMTGAPIELSSVWDFHNTDLHKVTLNKCSNLHKSIKALNLGSNEYITLYVHSIGRSHHSESGVAIFRGSHGCIYSRRVLTGTVSELIGVGE